MALGETNKLEIKIDSMQREIDELKRELEAIKEKSRKRVWPDEKPPVSGEYLIYMKDGTIEKAYYSTYYNTDDDSWAIYLHGKGYEVVYPYQPFHWLPMPDFDDV